MKAVRLHQAVGIEGLVYEEAPEPSPAIGDVLVKVHACGITPTELYWPIWTDRSGHERRSIIPGHEFSGVVVALGHGTAGVAACWSTAQRAPSGRWRSSWPAGPGRA